MTPVVFGLPSNATEFWLAENLALGLLNYSYCNVCLAQPIYFTIDVDDHLVALYFDGVQVPNSSLPNADNYKATDTVIFPQATRVIAVHAMNAEGMEGFCLFICLTVQPKLVPL